MKSLDKTLRNQLERTVKEARDIAETAARIALEQLGVGEFAPFAHLREPERELRRNLRVHGRQLGDTLNGGKVQTMDRLIEEVAYEHWHRMLFARFLVENDLLMYPDPTAPVAVTIEECGDLAAKEGAKNGWELAARFAACMLPQIFRQNSPVFQLALPPEHQQKLERLVGELPTEVFTASDSLGWVYQFWQAKKKDEVNASEVKIGARELPAVTQLFTEPYMVSFLLDNSIGAWWAFHRLTRNDLLSSQSEEELRRRASLPGVPLKYLRFIKSEAGLWTSGAITFDSWPEHLNQLKTLDPCCGSGHFLVAAFLMLVPMRMELEQLSAKAAVDVVLRENLHGLEVDRRCVELAAFALALAAWRYPGAGGYRQLPELNIACSGLAISAKKEEWLALAGDNANLQYALQELHKQFKDASVLGSLINPEIGLAKGTLIEMKWEEVEPLLTKALSVEKDYEKTEIGVVAQGVAKAANILTTKYDLVFTNVPYLKRGKQARTLQDFGDKHFSRSKDELATIFLERCLELCRTGGLSCVVMPHYWMFHGRSIRLRKHILENFRISIIAVLGPGAFETISGEVVNVGLFSIIKKIPTENSCFIGLDVTNKTSPFEKEEGLKHDVVLEVNQKTQFKNPDQRVVIGDLLHGELLSQYAETAGGMQSFDKPRFILSFIEIPFPTARSFGWIYLQSTINQTLLYDGRENFFLWENGQGQLFDYMEDLAKQGYKSGVWRAGIQVWGKKGVLFKLMGERLEATIYGGYAFENTTGVLIPIQESNLAAIWCFCSSDEYSVAVRKIDKKLAVTNGNLSKVPFNLDYWTKVARKKYPQDIPKPYSDDPTQWIFHGYPAKSVEPLQVAVTRLLGYRWPSELDSTLELSDEARACVKKTEALLPYADQDGIVCIPSVRGEMKAADRLENLLAASYGDEWSSSKKSQLLAEVNNEGKTLETWLREKFFAQHCKLFHDRPFIWHIWDGLNDGFAALVNYHKLNSKLLEVFIYNYLGDWISRQKQDKDNGVDGADERLAAAETLKKRLELILEGETPYDIFVRWKPIQNQPIGWNPDINDGVRLNIRPFMNVPDVGKKGAGVLRDKPNIKWDRDRGKDVESAPWYHLFKGERINDHHLSLVKKHDGKTISVSGHFGGK